MQNEETTTLITTPPPPPPPDEQEQEALHATMVQKNEKDPLSLSLFLLKECPALVRYNKELYQYNGKCFDILKEDKLMRMFHDFIRKYGIVKAWTNRKNVIDSLRAIAEIPTIESFNSYPELMCIENGVLDIYTKEVHPHSPTYYFDSFIHVTYDNSSYTPDCPEFMNYLNVTFDSDTQTIENIVRLGGYLFDATCKAGKMFLFDGQGGSGKSTLIDTFSMFFHTSSDDSNQVTAMSLDELASGSFDKEDLLNSRVNLAAEAKKGYVDAEEIKKIVTGDRIKVSRKFERAITFVPKTKIVVACNGLPKFTDTSDGIFRRLILVRFPNQFRTQEEMDAYNLDPRLGYKLVDHDLPEKIRSEKNAIFNLFLEGLLRLKEEKYQFILTKALVSAMKQYRQDSDSLREFLESNYVTDFNEETSSIDIYNHFRRWHRINVSDTGSLKLRSAEMGKRIKEVYNLNSSSRRNVTDTESGERERQSFYNLTRITLEDPNVPPIDSLPF